MAHMLREGHWDESVVLAPNEKARCVQTCKSSPESIRAVRLFKIDVPNGRVERQPSTSGPVHSQELIDTRLCPPAPGAGNHQSHRSSYGVVRHELEQPELGAKEPNKRNPSAFLPPSKRGRQEHEAVNSVWVAKSEFDGNSAPEAVAHDRRALDAECVHELDYSPTEEWWIVARTERLVRISEARQINSDDLELASERRDRREERDLGCPEPMNHQYRFTGARPHYRQRSGRCRHPFKSNASGVVKTAGRRQNCNAQVKIVPNDEATSPVSGQTASCILCNRQPRGPIGDESRIANAAPDGSTDLKFRAVNGNIPLSFVDYDCPNSRVLLGTIENRCVKASRKRTKDLFHGFSQPRLRGLGGTACLRFFLRHSCPTFGCPSALLGGKESTRILRMTVTNCPAASADISMIRVRNCDTPVIKDEIAELTRESRVCQTRSHAAAPRSRRSHDQQGGTRIVWTYTFVSDLRPRLSARHSNRLALQRTVATGPRRHPRGASGLGRSSFAADAPERELGDGALKSSR